MQNGIYVGGFVQDMDSFKNWLAGENQNKRLVKIRLKVRQKIFYKQKIHIEWLK